MTVKSLLQPVRTINLVLGILLTIAYALLQCAILGEGLGCRTFRPCLPYIFVGICLYKIKAQK